jgi:hypothetical protein
MSMVRLPPPSGGHEVLASLQTLDGDWAAIKVMSLWLFHSQVGAIPSLPREVPAIASWRWVHQSAARPLATCHGRTPTSSRSTTTSDPSTVQGP